MGLAFAYAPACDLADRLFLAMMAVAEVEPFAGDIRCPGEEDITAPASGIFLHVDNADGTEFVHIDISGAMDVTTNVFDQLSVKYAKWRYTHNCPPL